MMMQAGGALGPRLLISFGSCAFTWCAVAAYHSAAAFEAPFAARSCVVCCCRFCVAVVAGLLGCNRGVISCCSNCPSGASSCALPECRCSWLSSAAGCALTMVHLLIHLSRGLCVLWCMGCSSERGHVLHMCRHALFSPCCHVVA